MEQSASIGSNARLLLQGGPRRWRPSPFELMTLLAILLVGVFIGYTLYARLTDLNKRPPAAASYLPAFRTTLVSTVSTTGTVAATQQVSLNFDMGTGTAKIQKFFVGLGDKVTAGQPLAKVDDSDLSKTLTSAQSNLSAAQARLNAVLHPSASDIASAHQNVASAQSQVTTAQNSLDKLKNPLPADVASAQQSISQAQNQVQTAQNAITTAQNNLTQAQADAQTAELSAQTSFSSLQSAWNSASVSCSSSGMVPLSPIYGSIAATVVIPTSVISAGNSSGSASATPTSNSTSSSCQSALNSYNSAASSYNTSLANVQTKSNSIRTTNQALNNGSLQSAVNSAQLQLQTANQKYLALMNPTAADLSAGQSSLDSAKASLAGAQAKRDQLYNPTQDTVLPLQASVDQAQASVSTAQKNLDAATITAPFDGTISQVNGDVGTLVTSSTTVFVLLNPNLIRVDASVDQADINNLKQGQSAVITFDALSGRAYVASVSAIGLTPTVSSGVVTYTVTFAIDTSTLAAGTPIPAPGMTGSISVTTSRTENALVVPNRTIRRTGGRATVTVKKADGTQEQRQVTTGATNGTLTQVTNGLQDGDEVLVSTSTSASQPQISGTPGAGLGGGPPVGGPPPGLGP